MTTFLYTIIICLPEVGCLPTSPEKQVQLDVGHQRYITETFNTNISTVSDGSHVFLPTKAFQNDLKLLRHSLLLYSTMNPGFFPN